MNKPRPIRLTEYIKTSDGFKEQPVIFNAEGIVTVQTQPSSVSGPVIIGATRREEVTVIMTIVGSRINVTESIDEVYEAINAATK